jgi:DNA-binding LacI/PurR family transcriptional regulator
MKEIGLELLPELFVDGDHSIEAGMKALCALTAMPDRPSAVLCSNDMTAIGVMRTHSTPVSIFRKICPS